MNDQSDEREREAWAALEAELEDEAEREAEQEQQEKQQQKQQRQQAQLAQARGESQVVETYVAGACHYDWASVQPGPAQLVAEPNNPHDANAIRVEQDGKKLGYVPAFLAPDIESFLRAEISDVKFHRLTIFKTIFDEPFGLLP